MSQQSLAEAAVEVMKRVEAENQAISAQEIILDNSNKVSFPGYPYTFRALTERILVSIDVFKTGYECKTCKGKKQIEEKQGRESVLVDCPTCHGLGATLILPETSKNLPTTGVIVSMGLKAMEELAKEGIHIGDRILFGAHAGTMIPTKVGLMFKYMDWYCAALKIEGADDMSAFDFILQAE
jgi:hypothetical protein